MLNIPYTLASELQCTILIINIVGSHMQVTIDLNNHSNQRWSQKLLRAELAELNRENAHLLNKQLERGLTEWESSRLTELYQDLMAIMQQISMSQVK